MSKTFEARQDVNFSIVSQRRVFAPRGMKGGEDGARGANTWFKRVEKEGEVGYEAINVGSNGIAKLKKGDRVRIETPGGGGWGSAE